MSEYDSLCILITYEGYPLLTMTCWFSVLPILDWRPKGLLIIQTKSWMWSCPTTRSQTHHSQPLTTSALLPSQKSLWMRFKSRTLHRTGTLYSSINMTQSSDAEMNAIALIIEESVSSLRELQGRHVEALLKGQVHQANAIKTEMDRVHEKVQEQIDMLDAAIDRDSLEQANNVEMGDNPGHIIVRKE